MRLNDVIPLVVGGGGGTRTRCARNKADCGKGGKSS